MYRVFVAEDETLVRAGIRNTLENCDQFLLCGEAPDGEMALPAIQELRPDILLADIKMPFMDGLELCSICKRIMPWMGLIIVSGHNEFTYTQQAISIGVDEYLLKPMNAHNLLDTLTKVALKLEQRKAKFYGQGNGDPRREDEKNLLRDSFLSQLTGGLLSAEETLRNAEEFNLRLLARCYMVAEAECRWPVEPVYTMFRRRQHVKELIGNQEEVIWFFKGHDRLQLVATGNDEVFVRETTYQACRTLQYGLEHDAGATVAVGIGSPADRMRMIPQSASGAHQALNFLLSAGLNRILGIEDLEYGDIGLHSGVDSTSLDKRIHYAIEEDLERIVQDFIAPYQGGMTNMIFSYYRTTELIMTCARFIEEIGGDPQQVFQEYNRPDAVLKACLALDSMENVARNVIRETLRYKEANGCGKYGDTFRKVKDYISENYNDPSLSLNVVARFAGFSPNHFSTLFSTQTGESFIENLTRVRIEKAKEFLLQGGKTAEVAFRTGYRDTRYFTYSFKKKTGMSPREFQEKEASKTNNQLL